MTPTGSAQSLPRPLAGGQIHIFDPGHARFGEIDVYLTPDGSGTILGRALWSDPGNRPQLIAQDAWAGLLDFLAAASRESTRTFVSASVTHEVLAHLYAQRVLRQEDLLDDNIRAIGLGVYEITLTPRAGREDEELAIRFSPYWTTVHAGRRETADRDED